MGFVSEELNETEKQLIKDGKASNMAVVYGKEASIWKVRPAAPQPPAPTLGPQEAPTPQPWTVETAPLVVKRELPLEYRPGTPASLPSLPPLFATNSKGFIPHPHWYGSTNTNPPKGFRLHVGILGVGGREEIRED